MRILLPTRKSYIDFTPNEKEDISVKVIAFNGSPRKKWNTAILLSKALEGASSQGAETEFIHLYDLHYQGCISCFSCKLIGSKSYGKCAVNDDLRPIFEKIEQADAIILGSPIYFGSVTGQMKSFLERLMFQYLVYDKERSTLFKRKMSTGFIYTMNVTERSMKELKYDQNLKNIEAAMKRIFGASESLFVTDTYQFDDYSKYVATAFNEREKAKRREEEFPKDCQKAYDMGVRFARSSI
jgi:multimeric flavodoxin WrbA